MKKNLLFLKFFVSMIFIFTSCNKIDNLRMEENNQSKPNIFNELSEELIFIETPLLTLPEIEEIESQLLDNYGDMISDTVELKLILSPLIENGQLIYNELLSKLENTEEYINLSNEDKDIIYNLSSFQMAELSLLLSMSPINENIYGEDVMQLYSSGNGQLILDCLGAATGVADIVVIVKGYRGLNTRDVVRILKKTGARYLGYIGLALAIIDFIDCVTTAEAN